MGGSETEYYGIAIWILSLIRKKATKEDVKAEINRIVDEMYQKFGGEE
ncbi:hypothetical protein J41TS12_10880 [Paenibacillus antibioticophila]|uniref:Uncharacterized protein n=1 Tax=Paenibacillus antibioticophila TaxID=1274374 RepID=A0A919XNE3_9BACL|nr:hypothetical protein [Paenibacillus antibioticophila]GIO36227.1 hypothetical protein J41TS12_10880 [Paenibacillus antibioticophila]